MVAKRKRAKGGGRKPKGPFSALTSPLSIRMPTSIREELESAAQEGGNSVSQELLRRLSDTFSRKSRDSPPHIKSLERAISLLAKDIERRTGRRWNEDAFTCKSLRHGIDALLLNLVPAFDGAVIVPPQLEQAFASSPQHFREDLRDPASFGRLQADALAMAIESAPLATGEQGGMTFPAPSGLSYIRENIGSGARKEEKKR